MPAVVFDVKNASEPRDIIHRTVEALSSGKVVAVPTETVYGLAASALHPDAVERIYEIKGHTADQPLTVAAKSLEDALDYVPDMSLLARRIARRSWPGPVTLILPARHPDSVIHRLDPRVKAVTIPNGTIGLRVPDHELIQQVMRLCAGPIVLTSANPCGSPDPVTAQQVMDSIGDRTDLILDAGPCKLGIASSVVLVDGSEIKVLRQGSVDQETLERMANFIVLIVCTGNTCRSPMAEAILRQLIAEKLGCSTDELLERGIQVASAGIAAMPGAPATPQAVEAMHRLGLEIGDHASQPIDSRQAQYADLILTMTNHHRQALISQWPLLEPRTRTLRQDGGDVTDPIGSPVEVYDACARQIRDNLQAWVDRMEFPAR